MTDIADLDLEKVTKRLVNAEGWKPKRAQEAVTQYRNYLWLIKKYGAEQPLPPSLDIDEVWHAHVLHTREYHVDCEKIFGRYLHHDPQDFSDDVAAKEQHASLFAKTQELYKQEFGDYIYEINPKGWFRKCLVNLLEFIESIGQTRQRSQGVNYGKKSSSHHA